ncbi:MAG TPA: lipopolysaccharide transport periplasmic protein LptA [Casimicrobiaceae bacterium]|nr:lipopolysaccharide transport periplasmic protein LptA [Casimicrobiaceae bacterium]
MILPSRLLTAIALAAFASVASAETGDREKPINYSADRGDLNYETKLGKLDGNVVLTQGTITVRADRLTFKQLPDNSMQVTAFGNPVSFRQKKDGSDEYYEGFAQRVEYDGSKDLLELFDRALLKRGVDEIRSNYISYNAKTELFKAEGRPDTPAAAAADSGPGARVRGTFQPREGAAVPGKAGDKAPAKGSPAAPPATPLPLRPAGEPAPK